MSTIQHQAEQVRQSWNRELRRKRHLSTFAFFWLPLVLAAALMIAAWRWL